MGILRMVWAFLRAFLASRADLAAENAMLRHQLIVLQRSVKRPRLGKSDRVLFAWLSRLWSGWRSALLIIQPATVVHFNVTSRPPARWAAQQIVEAFPFEDGPRFLLRDRDGIYGEHFSDHVEHMGIEEVLIAPRSPWQNPYCERVIGSIRPECLDHLIVLSEDHLRRILAEYFEYYHETRAHLSLDRNSPDPRAVQASDKGKVVAKAYLGGLHHCYTRAA